MLSCDLYDRAIQFAPYLEVMTLLEEEFTGANPITSHQIFRGKQASVYLPSKDAYYYHCIVALSNPNVL